MLCVVVNSVGITCLLGTLDDFVIAWLIALDGRRVV